MFFRNLFLGTIILASLAFAQAADSTSKTSLPELKSSTAPIIAIKSDIKSLKKQKEIVKPNTTWSKIKDLFM